jgi:hypothetical protein
MYFLNLFTILNVKNIYLIDNNPDQIEYYKMIKRLILMSDDSQSFLNKLYTGDYDVTTDSEECFKKNLIIKMRSDKKYGSSFMASDDSVKNTEFIGNSRASVEDSMHYALKHFAKLKTKLTLVNETILNEDFFGLQQWIISRQNMFIYLSNLLTCYNKDKQINLGFNYVCYLNINNFSNIRLNIIHPFKI